MVLTSTFDDIYITDPQFIESTSKLARINVVAIGGGTGLSTLLKGIKKLVPQYIKRLTAIVTVSDNGGSSGKIIKDYKALPAPGDVRNCILALAENETLADLFRYRFGMGQLKGHSLGNLILTALTDLEDNFLNAIKKLAQILRIKGEVIPSLDLQTTLVAKFSNGVVVKGETQITDYGKKLIAHIEDIWLEPTNKANKPSELIAPAVAINRIKNADMIIIGPGSLYTSLVPNLLINNIKESLVKSNAYKLYISNIMTQYGETDGFNASMHIKMLKEVLGDNIFDGIVVNNKKPSLDLIKKYDQEKSQYVTFNKEKLKAFVTDIFVKDLLSVDSQNRIRHDSLKLAKVVKKVILQKVSK